MKQFFWSLIIICTIVSCKLSNSNPTGEANKELATLFSNYYKERLELFPLESTQNGDSILNDKMYIDFAGEKLSIVDKETGEVTEVEVFAAILGCSQLTYVEAVMTQRKEDLVKVCENALHYFGGVPAVGFAKRSFDLSISPKTSISITGL